MKKEITVYLVVLLLGAGFITKVIYDEKKEERVALENKIVSQICENIDFTVGLVVDDVTKGLKFEDIKNISQELDRSAKDLVGPAAGYRQQSAYFMRTAASLIILSNYTPAEAKQYLHAECRQSVIKSITQ